MVEHGQDVISPLGAYAARSCPVKTQWDVLRPVEPAPPSAFLASLGTAGMDFEGSVFEELAQLHAHVELIGEEVRSHERADRTSSAIGDGVPLILGGRLPVDHTGGRVAQPDVLVRNGNAPMDGRWRYLPVDVKHHGSLVEPDRGAEVVVQDLTVVGPPQRGPVVRVGRRDQTTKKDLLQLAHYQRRQAECSCRAAGAQGVGSSRQQ